MGVFDKPFSHVCHAINPFTQNHLNNIVAAVAKYSTICIQEFLKSYVQKLYVLHTRIWESIHLTTSRYVAALCMCILYVYIMLRRTFDARKRCSGCNARKLSKLTKLESTLCLGGRLNVEYNFPSVHNYISAQQYMYVKVCVYKYKRLHNICWWDHVLKM